MPKRGMLCYDNDGENKSKLVFCYAATLVESRGMYSCILCLSVTLATFRNSVTKRPFKLVEYFRTVGEVRSIASIVVSEVDIHGSTSVKTKEGGAAAGE